MQPLTDIHLHSQKIKGPEAGASEEEMAFLTLIGVLILVIAWINYINLSTAKSTERAREVGLRKVVGGRRAQIIGQFLLESVLINLLALMLGAAIVWICFPFFGGFIGWDISHGTPDAGIWHAPLFRITVAIFVACIGLLGLSSFMIRLRTKETGIRKVLGASVTSLVLLFSKDFIRLVGWASMIAIPVIYIGASRWLRGYAFHIGVEQNIEAALSNPIESLKTE